MKKHLITAVAIGTALIGITAANNDPVLMRVAGNDVPLSEFEYYFHKNNSQQVEPQTLDEYVDMFVNYKLKVADARAEGIDTTKAFIDEYTQFRNELAQPYLRDKAVEDSLVAATYEHMKYDLLVSHIMLPENQEAMLDSLRSAIVTGNAKFEDVAREYSIDKPSGQRGGLMGYVIPGGYPAPFEAAAYELKEHEVSPVVNSGYGVHIIRAEKRTPAAGEVNASHILRLTRGITDQAELDAQKVKIDSIYNVLAANPEAFEELAREFSQDGSARQGGSLGWFGKGAMVAEFDSVAFAIAPGEISRPFATQFGWHIVKKNDARGMKSLDESRDKIVETLKRSSLGNEPERAFLRKAKQTYKASLIQENIDRLPELLAAIAQQQGLTEARLDSATLSALRSSELPLLTVNGRKYTVADIAAADKPMPLRSNATIAQHLARKAAERLDALTLDCAREGLADTNADYANLLNEYRDGILLFEVSNRKVWDRAQKDREGLEDFFRNNRERYTWESPKFKSYVIFATNDSILTEAFNYASALDATLSPAEFTKEMREHFGRDIKIERVIAAKGENPITDYLGFGGPKPSADSSRWPSYRAFSGRLLSQPEEAADVRGAVITDYQKALEDEWLNQLHKRYKVDINKKVLKKVK